MENMELTKVRAEGRVRLLTVVFMLLVLAGGVREYQAMRAPEAQATVIYVRGRASEAEQAVAEEAKPQLKEVADAAEAKEQNEPLAESDGAAMFFGYLNEVNQKLEKVSKPESALAKIIVTETKPEEPAHEVIFEDGRIEIFDSEAGVVGVVETGVAADDEIPLVAEPANDTVAAEAGVEKMDTSAEVISEQATEVKEVPQAEESVLNEAEKAEISVNAEENSTENEPAAEEDGAIDMMKEIAARAEAEAKGN